jgi:hypothetical protein
MSEWIVAGLHAPGKHRPPDPENRSATVGTARGAEIQRSVLQRTTPKFPNRHASVQPAALSACDRQDRIGSIAEHDGEHHACDVTLTPLQAVRQKCLWCCNGSAHEVALCLTKACPSWPFRFGRKPTAEIIADQGDTLLHPLVIYGTRHRPWLTALLARRPTKVALSGKTHDA